MASQVSTLVDRTTIKGKEQDAFAQLEALGPPAVPYLVSHLGDMRPLPEHEISLANNFPGAFEGLRHYSPQTVHDALAAILNQLTSRDFVSVYNGASPAERRANAAQWRVWCIKTFPEKASVCGPG
jgi:hypothetical protein